MTQLQLEVFNVNLVFPTPDLKLGRRSLTAARVERVQVQLGFGLGVRSFPPALQYGIWETFFADPPRTFFSSGDYHTAPLDDFDTV